MEDGEILGGIIVSITEDMVMEVLITTEEIR
jgi:hypothetical protein